MEAWQALLAANDPPRVFMQGRLMGRLERETDGALICVNLTRERLRHELGRMAVWYKPGEDEDKDIVLPPMWIVDDMLARPEPPLPSLTRIIETPVFAPDGTLQTSPGYHAASHTFYDPPKGLTIQEVPAHPSIDDITLAKLLIAELLHDFPFVAEADRAQAIGLFLLLYVRDLILGPTPNHLIESPGPGSGKGLLADALLRPSAGCQLGIVTEARDEDEWRKRLTSRLKEGRAVLLLDNIKRPLDSAQLAGALTALVWEDRLLGLNETTRLPMRCAWVTTGNNPVLSTEMARRSIRIRLDPKIDRPWLREGFLHADLRAWVDANRARLIWAALVLVQNWLAQGRPSPSAKPLGSYEQWTTVVGDILEAAGISGFLANLDEFYEIADQEGSIWRAFVAVWWSKFGEQEVGAGELFPLASSIDGFDLGKGSERAQKITFGIQLGKQRDRVIAGNRVTLARTAQRAKQWRLLPVDSKTKK
jgi:putative DNA primase/helicase